VKKTFPLKDPKHKPDRVVDGIKHQIRKYLKRERRKALPEGADFWDFDCRVGAQGSEQPVEVGEIIAAIDEAAKEEPESVYVEILAKPGKRPPKADGGSSASD